MTKAIGILVCTWSDEDGRKLDERMVQCDRMLPIPIGHSVARAFYDFERSHWWKGEVRVFYV